MRINRYRSQFVAVFSLLVVILTVFAAVSLPNAVLADDGGSTKSTPYIYGGTVHINGFTIDEYLDSLEQYTGYLQVDRGFDFVLSAEIRTKQPSQIKYPKEPYAVTNPVTVDDESKFENLIFQPQIQDSYIAKNIYFSLSGTVSGHTEWYNRLRLDNASNPSLVLNFKAQDTDVDQDGLSDLAEKILGIDPNNPDSDNDLILDGEEVIPGVDGYETDPKNSDTDGDGVLDYDEIRGAGIKGYTSNPSEKDSDFDGIHDGEEIRFGDDKYVTNPLLEDTDGDFRTDLEEVTPSDPSGFLSDPTNADTDGDGLSDFQEIDQGNGYITDPKNLDSDGDGLSDNDEIYVFKSHPNQADSDGDGLRDGDEVSKAFETDPTKSDSDGDGLSDREEVDGVGSMDYHSDPNNPDSDLDGITDGEEVKKGNDGYITDPREPDTDNDGITDGAEVTGENSGYLTDPTKIDTDGDGISDGAEVSGSGPDNYQSDPTAQDSDSDGILDKEEVEKGNDNKITNPMNEDTDGDGLNDKYEIDRGWNPNDRDTDHDLWSDKSDPLKTIHTGYIGVPIILLLALGVFQVIRIRRLASEELVTETKPEVLSVARKIIFDTAFDQSGVIRTRDARRAIMQATRQIRTKPWPNSPVREGADTILEALDAAVQNNQLRIEYLVEFTSHQDQIRRLITQLAEEWWGFIPEDEIWRIAPELLYDGVVWTQHPLAQEAIDCAVVRAGGVRLISGSLMTRGYQFDEIIKRYSKQNDLL